MAQITIQVGAVTGTSPTIANAKAADVLARYDTATGGTGGTAQEQLERVIHKLIEHIVSTARLAHKNTRYSSVETEIDAELEAINLD